MRLAETPFIGVQLLTINTYHNETERKIPIHSNKKVTILDYSNAPKEFTDYEYFENSTTIYTKDGIDYRKL